MKTCQYCEKLKDFNCFKSINSHFCIDCQKKIKADYKHAARLKTGSLGFVAAVSGLLRGKSGKLYLVTLVLSSKKKAYLVPERDLILDQLWNAF